MLDRVGLSERSDHSPGVTACARCGWPIDTGIRSFWLAEDGFWTRVTGLGAGANPVVYCPLCFTALGREKGITVWWEAHSDTDPNPNASGRVIERRECPECGSAVGQDHVEGCSHYRRFAHPEDLVVRSSQTASVRYVHSPVRVTEEKP